MSELIEDATRRDSSAVIRALTDAGLSVLTSANPSREKEGFSILPNWRMKQLSEAMTAAHSYLKANP